MGPVFRLFSPTAESSPLLRVELRACGHVEPSSSRELQPRPLARAHRPRHLELRALALSPSPRFGMLDEAAQRRSATTSPTLESSSTTLSSIAPTNSNPITSSRLDLASGGLLVAAVVGWSKRRGWGWRSPFVAIPTTSHARPRGTTSASRRRRSRYHPPPSLPRPRRRHHLQRARWGDVYSTGLSAS